MALRRDPHAPDRFPEDVVELLHYFEPADSLPHAVRAIPGCGLRVPVWILGSSLFSAVLAARLGLPYAFASHFAPGQMEEAIALYRHRFEPSDRCASPHVMLTVNMVLADDVAEANVLVTSLYQYFLALRRGRPSTFPPPDAGLCQCSQFMRISHFKISGRIFDHRSIMKVATKPPSRVSSVAARPRCIRNSE